MRQSKDGNYTKQHFQHSVCSRMNNPILYITARFFPANHSSLESQVELTGMLSSREQNPFPIPLINKIEK